MATYVKFQKFVEDLGNGVHNLETHVLVLYLTNATPDAATHAVAADLAEITVEGGYDEEVISDTAYSQTGGVGTLTGTDITWTATGTGFGPFRYVVMKNASVAGEPLIAYWDYGSEISVAAGESFLADFGANILTIT